MADIELTSKAEKANKKDTIIKDSDGYYKVTFGVINGYNSRGIYYRATDLDKVLGPSSVLGRRINEGLLIAEKEHPNVPMDRNGIIRETLKLRHDNAAAHIKKIELYNTHKTAPGFTLPMYLVYGWVKPYGPYGDILQEALDNPNMNVAFSIRSLVKTTRINGITVRDIQVISTWDWVSEPGVKEATKFNAAGLESMDVDITNVNMDDVIASFENQSTICKDGVCIIEGMKYAFDKKPLLFDL